MLIIHQPNLKSMKIKNLLLFILTLAGVQSFAQITISGELRPRAEYRNGYKTLTPNDVDAALFVSQRTRLNTEFITENYTFFVSIQDVRVWGGVQQLNTIDKNGFSIH